MKKLKWVGGLVLAAGLVALPVLGQDAAKKKEPPKAPVSPAQAVLEQWNDIGRKLTAMAEDFPEDKYEFKPNPEQRSFREGLLHVADVNYFFTNPVKGEKPPAQEDFSKDKLKTKAEVAAYVKKSFADGAAAIKAKGDAGLNSLVVDPYANQQVRVIEMAYGFMEHSGEHYGQLVVYYRVSGLVPPESRPKK
jgi:uncharacterized damage-inducible protein DinB